MPASATDTRERILDAAQRIVMRRGFASASVDAIQEEAEISRGTFFYHFPSKDDLARELLLRYAEEDREMTEDFMRKAERLTRDPLQQLLVFVGLHEELFEEMEDYQAGCLFASYSYEAGLFDDETHEVINDSVDSFKELVGSKIAEAMDTHPPRVPVEPYAVAEMAYGIMQGAFIVSRVRDDRSVMLEHLRQFRTYLELLFGVEEVGSSQPQNAS